MHPMECVRVLNEESVRSLAVNTRSIPASSMSKHKCSSPRVVSKTFLPIFSSVFGFIASLVELLLGWLSL